MKTMGVAILLFRNLHDEAHLLIGERQGNCARGPGCLAFPGGMVEPHEMIIETCHRELEEETGLKASFPPSDSTGVLDLIAVTDHLPLENHITFWIPAMWIEGEPVVREPDKCRYWQWATLAEIVALGSSERISNQEYWLPPQLNEWVQRYLIGCLTASEH